MQRIKHHLLAALLCLSGSQQAVWFFLQGMVELHQHMHSDTDADDDHGWQQCLVYCGVGNVQVTLNFIYTQHADGDDQARQQHGNGRSKAQVQHHKQQNAHNWNQQLHIFLNQCFETFTQ